MCGVLLLCPICGYTAEPIVTDDTERVLLFCCFECQYTGPASDFITVPMQADDD